MSGPDRRDELVVVPTRWELIEAAFDREELRRICLMPERRFAREFGLKKTKVNQTPLWRPGTAVKTGPPDHLRSPDDFYAFKDNGASILAVAHLDTCVWANERMCDFADTADGLVVHSGALDDRLGAYVILDMLPKLGINVDVLLTTGEETGKSTAKFFHPPKGKEYNWMIEFDRGGTDVVMYQYDSKDMDDIVRASGARTANGAFSDISALEHLRIKGFNWGVGYEDYHSVRGFAYLDDLFAMLVYFTKFHEEWADLKLEHDPKDPKSGRGKGRSGGMIGTGWRAESDGWWAEYDKKRDNDKKEGNEPMQNQVLDKLDEESGGPMVVIEDVSLDQLREDELNGSPPQWGSSLVTDPTNVDFVSPA